MFVTGYALVPSRHWLMARPMTVLAAPYLRLFRGVFVLNGKIVCNGSEAFIRDAESSVCSNQRFPNTRMQLLMME